MKNKVALEFCVTDLKGAQTALKYGADRIELCTDLNVGGLTPSFGLIKSCADIIETHVLIRPRAGNFNYREEEVLLMITDVNAAHQAGATGVVFGCLTDNGELDILANKRMLESCQAKGLFPTFHRAFDYISNGLLALETLADLGFKRVLTAGQASSALEGIANLRSWQEKTRGRIQLMAGGGVDPSNAKALLAVGVDALHCSIHQKDNAVNPMGEERLYNQSKAADMKAIVDRGV